MHQHFKSSHLKYIFFNALAVCAIISFFSLVTDLRQIAYFASQGAWRPCQSSHNSLHSISSSTERPVLLTPTELKSQNQCPSKTSQLRKLFFLLTKLLKMCTSLGISVVEINVYHFSHKCHGLSVWILLIQTLVDHRPGYIFCSEECCLRFKFCSAVRIITWGGSEDLHQAANTHKRNPQLSYTHTQQMLQSYIRLSAGKTSHHMTHIFSQIHTQTWTSHSPSSHT